MTIKKLDIEKCIQRSESRVAFWINFIRSNDIKIMAEIGVFRGDFACSVLEACDLIEKYYFIDPWRHLSAWNKPRNFDDNLFQEIYNEAIEKTNFAAQKRVVLRGKTTEVIDEIPDNSLEFVYIDGDHTLRGITIDLILAYPKIKKGGIIGGDDFCRTIWQHDPSFEPTLVFPFVVYFAEAMNMRIYSLPYNQFLMEKSDLPFSFEDLIEGYSPTTLRDHISMAKLMESMCRSKLIRLYKIVRKFL